MICTEFSTSLGVEAGHGCSASHERREDSHPGQAFPGDREMERHPEKGCLRSRHLKQIFKSFAVTPNISLPRGPTGLTSALGSGDYSF